MVDPCLHCPCNIHKQTCRKFCTVYKAAVRKDVHIGMVEIFRNQHDRIVRAKN